MPRSGGELVQVDNFEARAPVGRPPALSSGRSTIRATSPGPSGSSKFTRPASARKRLDSESPPRISSSSSTLAKKEKDFYVGQKIKIKRPVGKAGYADGVIRGKNFDGTYMVEYDGHEVEKDVKVHRIALPPITSSGMEEKEGKKKAI